MKLKHIIEAQQFDRNFLEKELFPLAKKMEKVAKEGGSKTLAGKRMITLFYEPSTRTRASFEIAMELLGGRVVFSTENARQFSSAAKGETLEDTIRILNGYFPDVIVLRYDEEGGAKRAAAISKAPIINAGDGKGQHPTQALLDIYTIKKELEHIDNLSIAIVGDLEKARQVPSLSYMLANFAGVKIYFVSPVTAKVKKDIKDYLKQHHVWFKEESDLRNVAPMVNIIYAIRKRKEYGTTVQMSDRYIVNGKLLSLMKRDAIIMDALPRIEEISTEVDLDPRAAYFRQAENGLYIRMALLKMILNKN